MKGVPWLAAAFLLMSVPLPLQAQGAIKGRVLFEGTAPEPEKIEVKSDTATCGTEKEVRKILLGAGQGVANAVVTLAGTGREPEASKGSLDQLGCEFVPHVQVLPLGSTLTLTSSDSVLHNAHGFFEDGATAFNIAVPFPGIEVAKKLDDPGTIRLRCDAGHTWMSAYIIVTESPYYALTDGDGNFAFENLPQGRYEIEVWQEWLGRKKQPVEVIHSEETPVTIRLKSL